MANSFNGIGTTFYGQAHFDPDDSFVTTKWFIIGYIPVFPVNSLRVRYLGSSGIPFLSSSSSYEIMEELPTDWAQAIRVWVYSFFILFLVMSVLAGDKPVFIKLLVCGIGLALPFLLRWYAKQNLK